MKVPVVARLPAVNAKVLVEVAGFGLKAAVTPLCRPEMERVTGLPKPFTPLMLTVVVPLLPRPMLKLAGETESEKFGPGVTLSVNVVELLRLAHTPLIVTVKVPVAAVPLAVSVSVLVPVVLVGLNDAVTPLGRPDAVKPTLPLKPPAPLTVTVIAPLLL